MHGAQWSSPTRFRATLLVLGVAGVLELVMMRCQAQEFPPLRFWGDLSANYLFSKSGAGDSLANQAGSKLRLNASSYVWRPWFGLVDASVVTNVNNRILDHEEYDSTLDYSLGGAMNLRMFPESRFPLRLYVERTDNVIDEETTLAIPVNLDNYTGTIRYGLEQRYGTVAGNFRAIGKYDHQDRETDIYGDDVNDSLDLGLDGYWGKHTVGMNGRIDWTSSDIGKQSGRSALLSGRHSYKPIETWSIESLVTVTDSRFQQTLNNHTMEQSILSRQTSSFTVWRPRISRALTVTGSFRATTIDTESEFNVLDSTTEVLTGGAVFELTPNTRLTGNVNVNRQGGREGSTINTQQSAGISYIPDTLDLWRFRYNWSAGVGLTNLTGREVSRQANGNINHSLDTEIPLPGFAPAHSSLGQGISTLYDTLGRRQYNLDHSLTLSWASAAGASSTMVSFQALDSRSFDRTDNEFQLLNLQFSRNAKLNRFSSLSGNMTLQATRSVHDDIAVTNLFASGDVHYRHTRFLGIRNLQLTSDLSVSAAEFLVDDTLPNLNETRETSPSEWKTRIEYLLGRLRLQLDARLIRTRKSFDSLVQVQVIRGFGDL